MPIRSRLIKYQKHLLRRILLLDENSIDIHRLVLNILFIHQALLNISYIHTQLNLKYMQIVTSVVRPQTVYQFAELTYVTLAICMLYLAAMLVPIYGSTLIGTLVQLLDVGIINVLFENANGVIGIVTQVFLIIIMIIRQFVVQGKLDVRIYNFGTIRNSHLIAISKSFTLIQMLLYQYTGYSLLLTLLSITASLIQILIWLLIRTSTNSTTLVTIIVGIHLSSIYFTIMSIIYPEQQLGAELIIIPLIFRIVDKCITTYMYSISQRESLNYMLIRMNSHSTHPLLGKLPLHHYYEQLDTHFRTNKSILIQDIMIYSSLLLHTGQFYESFIALSQLHHKLDYKQQQIRFTTISEAKLFMLISKCRKELQIKIKSSTNEQSGISQQVNQLMDSEESNFLIHSKIIQAIKSKIQHQLSILENRLSFWSAYTLVSNIIELKEQLEKQYEQYPSERTQAVLGFYLVEVLNDFLAANQLFSIAALAEDKLMKMGMNNQVFLSKLAYIIFDYQDNLTIRKLSNNAPHLFQLSNQELVNSSVNLLIPPGIQEHHKQLVEQLFKTGRSKFMKKFDDNLYIRPKDQLLVSIEFLVDISFTDDQLHFLAFFQPISNQPMSMVVNQQRKISAVSEALLIHSNIPMQQLIGEPIDRIIPKFIQVQTTCVLENIEVQFKEALQYSVDNDQSNTYQTTLQVNVRQLNGEQVYFIIVFEYLRRMTGLTNPQSQVLSPESPQRNHTYPVIQTELHHSEEVTIVRPYDADFECQVKENLPINFDISQSQNIFSPKNSITHENLIPMTAQPLYFNKNTKQKLSVEEVIDKRVLEIQQDEQMEDCGSQVSSLQGVRRSKYFKKYEITSKTNELKSYSKNHKLFIGTLSISLILQFILTLIQLVNIDTNLANLVSDIDLLQIKNLVFAPLESFLITRWSIFNYNALRTANEITAAELAILLKFPRSNLALGYDVVSQNVANVLNRPQLQEFLQNTYVDVQIYTTTNIGDHYNISLRNAITILLNYQYIFKMAYVIDGGPVTDSPYVYYSYRNYKVLKDIFAQLNEDILQSTIDRGDTMVSQILIFLIIILVLLSIFKYQIIYHYFKIQANYSRYLQCVCACDTIHIECEILRYKQLLDSISKDQNIFFKYTFHLETLEDQIEQLALKDQSERRLRKVSFQEFKQKRPKSSKLFILLYAILVANSVATYYQAVTFLGLYPSTALLYKEMSDVGTDVPTLYAQREIHYGRRYFPYFDDNDLDNILQEIKRSLNRTTQFSSSSDRVNSILLSDSFLRFYQTVENNNLCDVLDPEMAIKAIDICPDIINGNMKRGLKTDMDINQFTSKNYSSYLELEGAFLVSEIMRKVNMEFNIDLVQQTNLLLMQIDTYNIIVLVGLVITVILLATMIKQYLCNEYYVVQRMIYIAPRLSILMDDHFERNMRSMIVDDMVN